MTTTVAPSGTDVESTVELILRADGTVSSARVTRCLPDHPGLREAVVAAVRQWRFEPARLDGVAVDVVYSTQVDFVVAVEGVDGVDD